MRTTVTIDDDLFEDAKWLTGIEGKTALVREALRYLVETRERPQTGQAGRNSAAVETRAPATE